MSREQIDRILTNDIDLHLEQHLYAIDQITDQLALKSNFLSQFQLLLQQEISHNQPQQITSHNAPIDSQKKTIPKDTPQVAEVEKKGEIEVSPYAQQDHDENVVQVQAQKQVGLEHECCSCNKVEYSKMRSEVSICWEGVVQSRILYNQLANKFKLIVSQCRQQVIQIAQQHIYLITDTLHKRYKEQLQTLSDENYSLKQQLQQVNTPLKQLTFNQLNTNQIHHKQQDSICHKQTKQNVIYPQAVQPKLQSFPIKTKRQPKTSRQTIQYTTTTLPQTYHTHHPSSNHIQPIIPTIKPITIGVPPVRQGFGILKYNNRTIYKGMWSNGKFQGKGTLEWDNYSYVGQFKNGLFSGYGILQTQGMVYTGRFQSNKAEGEGTVQLGHIKRCGLWSSNQLIREY